MARFTRDLQRSRKVYPFVRSRAITQSGVEFKTITTSYTVQTDDYVIGVNFSAAGSITLPNTSVVGESYIIKDIGGNAAGNNVTISSAGSKNIDGSSTFVIKINYQSIVFIYSGSEWSAF